MTQQLKIDFDKIIKTSDFTESDINFKKKHLNKFIENNKSEITFKLELEPSLGRGDFTIDMGGVIQAIKYKKVIE